MIMHILAKAISLIITAMNNYGNIPPNNLWTNENISGYREIQLIGRALTERERWQIEIKDEKVFLWHKMVSTGWSQCCKKKKLGRFNKNFIKF